MNNSFFTSLCLKVIGIIFILSFLLDTIIFAYPLNWQSPQWQIGLVTAIVDRGIVPMVGIALILLASWMDTTITSTSGKSVGVDLRLPTFLISTLLGIIFLLLIPVHFNNINSVKTEALTQIEQGAGQGEEQIKNFLAQLNALSQNPQRLSQEISQRTQVIETGQFQGRALNEQQLAALRQERDQLQNLKNLSQKPKEFKQRLDTLKNQFETNLLNRRKEAEGRANTEAFRQLARIGLSSLMLTIGYSAIGWLGLLNAGKQKKSA
jgi:hypothetical protein